MSVRFFTQKRVYFAIIAIFAIVVTGILGYAVTLSRALAVDMQADYYFLVLEDDKVEVSIEFAKLDGGAGYIVEYEGKEYAALSVYEREEDALTVKAELKKSGKEGAILHEKVRTVYFTGKEKKHAAFYTNALKTLREYTSVLNQCISRLEKGMTQESCKRILSILQKQFAYAGKIYAEYAPFSRLCRQASETLSKLCKETVFVKDLRYLLCWQAEKYVELCAVFS